MKATKPKDYSKEINSALDNTILRKALDKFATEYPPSWEKAFQGIDFRARVNKIAQCKREGVQKLEALYAQFKTEAEKRGVIVHLAKDGDEANAIIARIAKEHGRKKLIKSKSLTSAETRLNQFLEKEGIQVSETDLGEYILQLRTEGPTHMVLPAVHLAASQVATSFSEVTQKQQTDDIDELVKVARQQMRAKFIDADMGFTGCNFAIAETGTIGVCTNEGNARLSSTLPSIHVVLVGLEKLVPTMDDAFSVVDVLPRNGTGQAITTYVSMITGRNESTLSDDKKKIMHVIFLDNGRLEIAKDPVFSEALTCVRCGACANVCPVYRLVGGHAMGEIYMGAIGLILTYLYHDRDRARILAENCINCGACKNICAAGIDLPNLIAAIRSRLNVEKGTKKDVFLISRVMKNRKLFHRLLRFAKFSQRPFTGGENTIRHLPTIFAKDHTFKTLPALAPKPFRDLWEKVKPAKPLHPKARIALFAGCAQDFVYPDQLEAALKVFEAHDVLVDFPMNQTCCGLPIKMMGEAEVTLDIAEQNIEAINADAYDYIVTLCASCASHLKHSYPSIIQSPKMKEEAERFSEKVIDFSSFCRNVLGLGKKDFTNTGEKISHHAACHLIRGLGVENEPKELIGCVGDYVEAREHDNCCGFGGTYSIKFPTISKGILEIKTAAFKESGATTVVTDCPGCVMQLRGGSEKMGGGYKVRHIAEILADNLKK